MGEYSRMERDMFEECDKLKKNKNKKSEYIRIYVIYIYVKSWLEFCNCDIFWIFGILEMVHAVKFLIIEICIIILEYDLNDLNDEKKSSSKRNRRVWERQRLVK